MNYFKGLVFGIVFLGFSMVGNAQTSKDVDDRYNNKKSSNTKFTVKRNAKKNRYDEDFAKRMKASSKSSKKGLLASGEDAHKDFEKRMKKVGKDNMKEERIMKKPQYSDPSYFGHKRKPKIRPVGKRKLCKECGLKH